MDSEEELPPGKEILQDASADSTNPELPAFLARPVGAPVYHGFPIIEETETDGWRLGAITSFEDPHGCTEGDGFVVAPDGTRAGLVWDTGDFPTYEISPPEPRRWGVYGVAFPKPVRDVADLVDCFRAVLPDLRSIYARVFGGTG